MSELDDHASVLAALLDLAPDVPVAAPCNAMIFEAGGGKACFAD